MRLKRLAAAALIGGLILFGGFLLWSWRSPLPLVDPPGGFASAEVARGAALARIGDCQSCHSVVKLTEFAGGRPVPTPFGTIYGANVTPDRETGIGRWSLRAFDRSLRDGVSRDGDHLYPAMPYDYLTRVKEEDIRALYAFLMTRRPVHADAPSPHLIPPLGFRPLLAGWKLLFLDKESWQPDPKQDARWNRGAYLVQGLAHCGACHSPRNLLGGEKGGHAFEGGETDGWRVPALTGRGATAWSVDQIETYLRGGRGPDGKAARGPMADVVRNQSQAPEPEVRAIATYIAWQMRQPVPST